MTIALLVAALAVAIVVLVVLMLRLYRELADLKPSTASPRQTTRPTRPSSLTPTRTWRRLALTRERRSAGRSAATRQQHLAPFMPEMAARFTAGDWRFFGSPVDFVVFDGLTAGAVTRIVLVEVKTNRDGLSPTQRAIKDAVDAGRVSVEFVTLRMLPPTVTVISPGQQRLREHVADAAHTVPDKHWSKQEVTEPLLAMRLHVMADDLVRADAITGQDLYRPPVSRTYAAAQLTSAAVELACSHVISADAIIYNQGTREPLACGGGFRGTSTYGALTWLSLDRPLPDNEPTKATVLTGSRNHRTLACFLWGDAPLPGAITVVDDVEDADLHAACRRIDSRLPHPRDQVAFRYAEAPASHAARRSALLELSQHIEPGARLPQHHLDCAEASLNHAPQPMPGWSSHAPPTPAIVRRAIELLERPAHPPSPRRRRWRP